LNSTVASSAIPATVFPARWREGVLFAARRLACGGAGPTFRP
jgi:hypothetical protein